MKIIDALRLAIGNLRRNSMRTTLTVSGVVIGIGAIVFLVSLAFGLEKVVIERTTSLEALEIIDVEPGSIPQAQLNEENIKNIQQIPNVEKIAPKINLSSKASFEQSNTTTCVIYAINPQYFSLEGIDVDKGKKDFSSEDASEAIISRKTIKLFDLEEVENALGKEITFDFNLPDQEKTSENLTQKLQIIGITREEKPLAYIPLKAIEKFNIENYNSAKVKVSDKNKIKEVQKKIGDMGFRTHSVQTSQIDEINKIFVIVKIILACFGMIALFVASIGIFNTMTISLLERTHEIGIMKALGATDRTIKRLFNYESSIIGLIGGIIGVLLGYLLGLGINVLIVFLAKTFEGEGQPVFYTPLYFALGVVIFSFVVSYVAGIYPARRASKLNPLEALRYE